MNHIAHKLLPILFLLAAGCSSGGSDSVGEGTGTSGGEGNQLLFFRETGPEGGFRAVHPDNLDEVFTIASGQTAATRMGGRFDPETGRFSLQEGKVAYVNESDQVFVVDGSAPAGSQPGQRLLAEGLGDIGGLEPEGGYAVGSAVYLLLYLNSGEIYLVPADGSAEPVLFPGRIVSSCYDWDTAELRGWLVRHEGALQFVDTELNIEFLTVASEVVELCVARRYTYLAIDSQVAVFDADNLTIEFSTGGIVSPFNSPCDLDGDDLIIDSSAGGTSIERIQPDGTATDIYSTPNFDVETLDVIAGRIVFSYENQPSGPGETTRDTLMSLRLDGTSPVTLATDVYATFGSSRSHVFYNTLSVNTGGPFCAVGVSPDGSDRFEFDQAQWVGLRGGPNLAIGDLGIARLYLASGVDPNVAYAGGAQLLSFRTEDLNEEPQDLGTIPAGVESFRAFSLGGPKSLAISRESTSPDPNASERFRVFFLDDEQSGSLRQVLETERFVDLLLF